ncbi:MAG: bifunctional alpha,alpha-trehalose-phosphate synthase (UDP-forming)/trehalose-phosphatase [Bacteroidota bacterium]
MARLVIVSNRLPITLKHSKEKDQPIYHPSSGGLATGLSSLDESLDKIWIGWPGKIADGWEKTMIESDLRKQNLVPVFLTEKDIELYYEGFSNDTLWPLFHYFTQYTAYRDDFWEAYRSVNRKFADAIIPNLEGNELVWVHDYQLMLLPEMIREAFPDISIGFFLHIPFPSYEVFRILPWREELLNGVLGADLIGFHTYDYMRHFLSAAYRISGYDNNFGKLKVGNRAVHIDYFPMGIDYEKYAFPDAEDSKQDEEVAAIEKLAKVHRMILSVDRLDYTKGIPNRIEAYSRFLKQHPEYHNKVCLVMIVVPSRDTVEHYRELKEEIDTKAGILNSTYGGFDWTPMRYMYRSVNFTQLTTLYRLADVAMITPVRDGMNLVAKEYVASKETNKKGVLILSEMAGAAGELFDAITINPIDVQSMADSIVRALEMDEKEQKDRLTNMQKSLKKYNVRNWASIFMKQQIKITKMQQEGRTNLLNEAEQEKLLKNYQKANTRLLVLDYDGTMMDFHVDPQAVSPDDELLDLLKKLHHDPKNRVVVSTGRDRTTIEGWLGHIGMEFSTEHGVWMKRNDQWMQAPGLSSSWKPQIRASLESLVERTPGSFIEEKQYSIAWHYRNIDRDLGEKRVREFRDVLRYLTANLDLQVLEGNKVVEIKNSGVNKGKAIAHWIDESEYDFIFAIGDDHTDEDTFNAMPEHAYTVKVGLKRTDARYNILSVEGVRELLTAMTGTDR